jgi:hypothetical protein
VSHKYKVVSFLGQNKGSLSAADVATQLERVINQYAVNGWEFYELADVNIEVRPGCIAGLFGASAQYVRFDQLIFRTSKAQVESAAPPSAEGHSLADSSRKQYVADAKQSPEAIHAVKEQPDLPVDTAIAGTWRKKSDDEIMEAVEAINDYTDKHKRRILLEFTRRNLGAGVQSSNEVRGEEDDLTYCYHCGAGVTPGIESCDACGKRL